MTPQQGQFLRLGHEDIPSLVVPNLGRILWEIKVPTAITLLPAMEWPPACRAFRAYATAWGVSDKGDVVPTNEEASQGGTPLYMYELIEDAGHAGQKDYQLVGYGFSAMEIRSWQGILWTTFESQATGAPVYIEDTPAPIPREDTWKP